MLNRSNRVRKIERVRYELMRRTLTVLANECPTPGFVRLTLGGADLASFQSRGFDDHIKVFVPVAGEDEPLKRDYTPRSFDTSRCELVLEFALHEGGLVGEYAKSLKVGDSFSIGGPKGSMVISNDYDWFWLVGDSSSLPAIHRKVEELEPGQRAVILVQLDDAADERMPASRGDVDVHWVRSREQLLQLARELPLPAGEGFVWAGGEGVAMTELRRIVADEKGVDPVDTRISAYWKQGHRGYSDKG
ncbi:siderophore-interacting protein [Parathalassolituus penaei]|uniref:Siderophore-interacting protein n=1 Tax=Parathalassolituus penaei TaxID=2997323 RepID=A0A9X3EEZ8_9GAMM|nr:siderophore-interacting protein [Parathalassolituus penaei]MCY0966327.1 siderophore-interacting protein [Parathalassolituus penaei]